MSAKGGSRGIGSGRKTDDYLDKEHAGLHTQMQC